MAGEEALQRRAEQVVLGLEPSLDAPIASYLAGE